MLFLDLIGCLTPSYLGTSRCVYGMYWVLAKQL